MQPTTIIDRVTKNLSKCAWLQQPFILHLNRESINIYF